MNIGSVIEVAIAGRCWPDGQWREIRVRDGVVASVGERSPRAAAGTERWIAPGFFDLQVNGFAGRDFLRPEVTVEDVEHIAVAVLRTGTTRFLATVITGPLEAMCRQLATIADAIERVPLVRQMCAGIHAEGPFIHPDDGPRGAHPAEHVRRPSIADWERLREAARGHLRMLTLASDQPGAAELIRHAAGQGVLVSVGHHRADLDSLRAAVAAGARMCTHLGNGCDSEVNRLDNPIWRQLGEDRLWASFIADGQHLPPFTLRCMLRAKTVARSILITDAVAPAGMPAGRYRLGPIEIERTPAGRVVLPGTPYLAGSGADMPLVVGRAIADGGVSVAEAIAMASANPAQILLGTAPAWPPPVGTPADAVEFEWDAAAGQLTITQAVAGPFAAP